MSNIIRVGATSLLSLSISLLSVLPGVAAPENEHNSANFGNGVPSSGSGSVSNAATGSQTESETQSHSDHSLQSNSNAGTASQSAASTSSSSESGFSLGSPKDGNPRDLPSGPPGGLDPNAGSSKVWGNGPGTTPPKPTAKSIPVKSKKAPKAQVKTYNWNK